MKIIEGLIQGSPEWHAWRKYKLTATSAGILMDHNPWESPLDLFNSIWGITPPKEKTAAMQRGNDLEDEARQLFIKHTGIDMIPICVEHDEMPWFAASLDGWSKEKKAVLEIKCPNEMNHSAYLEGHIPYHYFDQMQWQLFITGGEKAYFMTYRPEHETTFGIQEILPNQEYIDNIIKAAIYFYDNHINDDMAAFNPPKPWKLKE